MENILTAAVILVFVAGAWWFGVGQPPGTERDSRRLLALLVIAVLVILVGIALAELQQ